MAHQSILTVTTDIDFDSAPLDGLNEELWMEEVGADWGGDNRSENVDDFIELNLLDCVEKVPYEFDEDSSMICALRLDKDKAHDVICEWFEHFKEDVNNTSIEDILSDSYTNGRSFLERELQKKLWFEPCVYFDGQIRTCLDFVISWYNDCPDEIIFVNGCVDYHY